MTRAYSIADNSTLPSALQTLRINPSPSSLPPLLINSEHAAQTQTRDSNTLFRLGHASHFAAAAHSHAALRQASPSQQNDAEVVRAQACAWLFEIGSSCCPSSMIYEVALLRVRLGVELIACMLRAFPLAGDLATTWDRHEMIHESKRRSRHFTLHCCISHSSRKRLPARALPSFSCAPWPALPS
jgi:hypothetical protein